MKVAQELEKKEYSLVKLFTNYECIEIPIIQRDYAQGRASAEEIRKNFLETIKKHLEDEKIKLQLDFIYGLEEEDGKTKKFIPVDGQQRLTTLFLLHWYFAVKEGKLEEFKKKFAIEKGDNKYESKLRYKVRKSSEEFLDKLVSNDIDLPDSKDKDALSKTIQDKNWFYMGWRHDPTISGMLQMLDAIHETFSKDFNYGSVFESFLKTKDNPITFYFLPLDSHDFGNPDELYMKMNSRGKLLTPYENFKAKLEKLIEEKKGKRKATSIARKFDNDYLDIFWELAIKKSGSEEKETEESQSKSKKPDITDNYLYWFFYNLTLNLYASSNTEEIKKYNKVEDFIEDNSLLSFYQKVYGDRKKLDDLLKFLKEWHNLHISFNSDDDNILKKFFREEDKYLDEIKRYSSEKPTLWDRVRFYAFYEWILHHEKDEHFYRVLKNLINNIRIDTLDRYISALKAISEFVEKLNYKEILQYIKNNEGENFISFFSQNQQKEEVEKAKLIKDDSEDWYEEIKDAERHWYLDGKIGFLLDFSKAPYTNDKPSIAQFKNYKERFFKLWEFAGKTEENKKDPNKDNKILIYQALLTFGDENSEDYMPDNEGNSGNNNRRTTFCSFNPAIRTKIDNWHRVFNDSKKSKHLKSLLDAINPGDIKGSLVNLIDSYKFDPNDWKSYFIKNRACIDYCKHLQIRFDADHESTKKVYLLSKSTRKGWHVELHTWHLFTICFGIKKDKGNIKRDNKGRIEGVDKKGFESVAYKESKSLDENEKPCIVIDYKNGSKIKIYYEKGKYIITCAPFGNAQMF